MAVVPVDISVVGRDRGYPIEQLTVYICCDACGSFNVRHRMSSRMGKWVAAAMICAMGFWLLVRDGIQPGAAFICWPSFFILLLGLIGQYNYYLGHECVDCGNTHISDTVGPGDLGFDRDALPASGQRAHKHYYTQ